MNLVITPEMLKAGSQAANKWFVSTNYGGGSLAVSLAKTIFEAMHAVAPKPSMFKLEIDLCDSEVARLLRSRPGSIVSLPQEHNPSDIDLIRALVMLHDENTCTHEKTHRGGSIWTICSQCDTKWLDGLGGFVPYVDPPAIEQARALLESQK